MPAVPGALVPGRFEAGDWMNIAWEAFAPWPALAGGVLLGAAAVLLLLVNGRIAGVSGILGSLLRPAHAAPWQFAFVAGLLLAPATWGLFGSLPPMQIDAGWAELVAAGLLVGLGTGYASGCTSGHGVCGLSRLSPRSLVATLCFMGTGFATVYVARHVLAG